MEEKLPAAKAEEEKPSPAVPQLTATDVEIQKSTPTEKRGFRLPRGASAQEVPVPVRGANLDTVTLDSGETIAFDKRKVNADAVKEAARTGNLWKLTGGKAPKEAVEAAKQEIAGENTEKPPTLPQEPKSGTQVAAATEAPQPQPVVSAAPQPAAKAKPVEPGPRPIGGMAELPPARSGDGELRIRAQMTRIPELRK